MSVVQQHPELNRIYGDKIVIPPCLPVFLKHYARWVIFYKPMNLVKESHEWIEHLIQFLNDRNVPEKASPEQLDAALKDFGTEWDNAHVQDKDSVLEFHADEDYTIPQGGDVPRRLPPQGFEEICTNFTREVARYNPSGLIRYAERYFKALEINKVPKFLQRMAEKKVNLLPKRHATPEEHEAAQAFLASQNGGDPGSLQDMKREDTVKLIQRTLQTATAEQKQVQEQRRKEAEAERQREAAAAAEKQAKLEEELKARNIDLNASVAAELQAIKSTPKGKTRNVNSDEEEEDDLFNTMSSPVETLEMPEVLANASSLPPQSPPAVVNTSPQEEETKSEVASVAAESSAPVASIEQPAEPTSVSEPEPEPTPVTATEPVAAATESTAEATTTESSIDPAVLRREEIARKKAERLAKLKAEQAAREAAEQ